MHVKTPCYIHTFCHIYMCIYNNVCIHKHTQIMYRKLSICPSHPKWCIPPRNIKPICVNKQTSPTQGDTNTDLQRKTEISIPVRAVTYLNTTSAPLPVTPSHCSLCPSQTTLPSQDPVIFALFSFKLNFNFFFFFSKSLVEWQAGARTVF